MANKRKATQKSKRVSIRLDADLLRRLKREAASHYRTPSEYVRFLLEQELRNSEAA